MGRRWEDKFNGFTGSGEPKDKFNDWTGGAETKDKCNMRCIIADTRSLEYQCQNGGSKVCHNKETYSKVMCGCHLL